MPEKHPARLPRTLAAGLTLAASVALLLGTASTAAAAEGAAYDSITITAAPLTVAVGDSVTVTASATGLVDAYAYDLDLAYDPALLTFVADSDVTPAGGFATATDEGGRVSVVATRLGTSPGLTGDQVLVTLTFTAIAPGTADITMSEGRVVDSAGTASAIDAAGLAASVEITADEDTGSASAGTTGNGTASGTGSVGGDPVNAGGGTGPLATTGADAAPWLIAGSIAAVAIVSGAALMLARRRTR